MITSTGMKSSGGCIVILEITEPEIEMLRVALRELETGMFVVLPSGPLDVVRSILAALPKKTEVQK